MIEKDDYSKHGITIKSGNTTGKVRALCPECSSDRKKGKKDECLAVNLDIKVWYCHHCEWSGSLKVKSTDTPVYKTPPFKNNTEISDGAVKYFAGRALSQKTLTKMKITSGLEYMPVPKAKVNTIQFHFIKDGKIVNTKYRDRDKGFKLHAGCELCFYNHDIIEASKKIIITEGEMDALSFIEAGIDYVVSVPNGANNLKFLVNYIDLFEGKEIILALDNDSAGRKLQENLANRFGKERCTYIKFKDCKDANECLMEYGVQGILDALAKPFKFPLEGVFTVTDISDEIDDLYDNGLDKGVSTGIDDFLLRIVKGYLTVLTGIPGHGKSEWLDNIILHLRLEHGWVGALYSPENRPMSLHFAKLAMKLIGKPWDGHSRMTEGEKNLAKRFVDKSFWFIKPEKGYDLTNILSHVLQVHRAVGCDYFVIDAWNKLEHNLTDTDSIGKALDQIVDFCEKHHIHCFLVAHPKKQYKENKENGAFGYRVPTLYDIAGSHNFYAKADNGISVFRNRTKDGLDITEVHINKIKYAHWGEEGFSTYQFDREVLRYYPLGTQPNYENWINRKFNQQTASQVEKEGADESLEKDDKMVWLDELQ